MSAQKPTRSSFIPRVIPPARKVDPEEMQRFAERGEAHLSESTVAAVADDRANLQEARPQVQRSSVPSGKMKQFHCKLPVSLWLQLHSASGASEETDTPLTMGEIAIEALRARLSKGTSSPGGAGLHETPSTQEAELRELRALLTDKNTTIAALEARIAQSSERKGEGRGVPVETLNLADGERS